MRLAFISDIHGNALALKAVLGDIKTRNVDKVYVLGDICFRGPEPQRCLSLIQSLNSEVIKGNADEWVVRGIEEGEAPAHALEMMNKEKNWTLSQLEDNSIEYLQNLDKEIKIDLEDIRIHAFHATPNSLFDIVLPNEIEENFSYSLSDDEADIYVYGHIHQSFVRYLNGKCIINTGSVGLPLDGLDKASYAIIEIDGDNYETSIIRVEYDIELVLEQFRESDYPNKEFMINLLQRAKV